ncbi:MAG: diguanylate cyclase [Acidimicrobiia bacterium]|nr:diguanylate cyclase [Acidimicrobiia bacterium]
MLMSQLAILIGDATLVGGLVLLLFWLRRYIGLNSLFVAIGAIQYLQVVLAASVYVEILPNVWVSPGSAALFPATIFAVLLIYVEGDANGTRTLAYSLVISNLVLFAISTLAAQHLRLDHQRNLLDLPPALFQQNSRIVLAGTLALFVDIVALIVILEAISRRFGQALFLPVLATLILIMALDSVLFATGAFLGQGNVLEVMVQGFVGKAIVATFYAGLLFGYARLVEVPGRDPAAQGAVTDVFALLTYRQRYEAARAEAIRDKLTGLFNRGYCDEYIPKQIAHAKRSGRPTSLVVIDADGLKQANDRYGHPEGDRLLRVIAETLSEMVRVSDMACRYGGDEFIVVLTAAYGRAARVFAERLIQRLRVRSRALDPPLPWGDVGVTIGIATYPTEANSVGDLIALADQRLYQGKRAGGGRVTGGEIVTAASPVASA